MMNSPLNSEDDRLKKAQVESAAGANSLAVHQPQQAFGRRAKIEKLIGYQGKVRFSADWRNLRRGWARDHRGTR